MAATPSALLPFFAERLNPKASFDSGETRGAMVTVSAKCLVSIAWCRLVRSPSETARRGTDGPTEAPETRHVRSLEKTIEKPGSRTSSQARDAAGG
jgi:hypothetical protein